MPQTTKEFLDLILPDDGVKVVAAWVGGKMRHKYLANTEQMARWINHNDQYNIYHACATYLKHGKRTHDNVALMQSLWADIDVGEDKPYATTQEAARALGKFQRDTSMPKPLVVLSGRGLHVYWLLDNPVAPPRWTRLANSLADLFQEKGLAVDPARTRDPSSVLRPVGSWNLKEGRTPVEVAIISKGEPVRTSYSDMLSAVDPSWGSVPAYLRDMSASNNDLAGGFDESQQYEPSSAVMIADRCAMVAQMRDTRGQIEEPQWRATIGILKHTEEAPDIIHEWSKGHRKYSRHETDKKIDRWTAGPTTCDTLSQHDPDTCKGCPFNGSITSPISLGRAPAEAPVEEQEPDSVTVSVEMGDVVEERTYEFPKGYRRNVVDGQLRMEALEEEKAENEDGDVIVTGRAWRAFADAPFYPVDYRPGDSGHMVTWQKEVMWDGVTSYEKFDLPSDASARTQREQRQLLTAEMINVEPHMVKMIEPYLHNWNKELKKKSPPTRVYEQFGWHGNEFVIGRRVIAADGTAKDAYCAPKSSFSKVADDMVPHGSFEVWKQIIDTGYNKQGYEALQFYVLCGLAAPLFAEFEELGGVTVHARSSKSGKGKTTMAKAALSMWGDPKKLIKAHSEMTPNFANSWMSLMNNLPAVIDEATNITAEQVSKLLYEISQGEGKQRLNRSAQMRDTLGWATIALTSANASFVEKVAGHRTDASAEAVRVFEFAVNIDHSQYMAVEDQSELLAQLSTNYGFAGPVFMEYIVRNRETVKTLLQKARRSLIQRYAGDTSERFWFALCAAVVVTNSIAKRLGLVQFDMPRLLAWIEQTLNGMRHTLTHVVTMDMGDALGEMVNALAPETLGTAGRGDPRRGRLATVLRRPKGKLSARFTFSGETHEPNELWVATTAVSGWCKDNGVAMTELEKRGRQDGWLISTDKRYCLGSGTDEFDTGSRVRVWQIEPPAHIGTPVDTVAD